MSRALNMYSTVFRFITMFARLLNTLQIILILMWVLGWFWNTLCSMFYKVVKSGSRFLSPSLSSLCQLIHHNSYCSSITSVRTKPIWHLFPSISASLLFQAKLSQFFKERNGFKIAYLILKGRPFWPSYG